MGLAGAVVDTVIVGDGEGIAAGVDGEALDLVDHITTRRGEIGQEVADDMLRHHRKLAVDRRGFQLCDRHAGDLLHLRGSADLAQSVDDAAEPERRQHDGQEVDGCVRRLTQISDPQGAGGQREQGDRQHDPEDPAPREGVEQEPRQRRPDRGGE